ncbi:uncharacterized protein LOC132285951 [Cornus florida]|uniref:uncharacterized protein LOC132285951 n=1 Tax=Cornus florida TaxID=4283 RepID=UPI00289E4FF7|nr:uncharacterized protein LOC132285951 [Cornus florida]
MAIELCSENSCLSMSPRISFSHDLSQTDIVPVEQHRFRSNSSSSSIDFDFCVLESFELESSSADELFFDGKILPIQIKKKIVRPKQLRQSETPPPPPPPPPPLSPPRNVPITDKVVGSESDEKRNSKSFWRFKRSSSLNCGSGYARTLCPLPLLSRSNSTGSAQSVKRSSFSKDSHNQKQHNSHKNQPLTPMKQSQSSNFQKPPLKKNYGSHHGNGVRINPVLNVPTASLFGLGSIFSGSGRDRNKKR